MYILLPSGSVEEPVRYLRITHKFRDETQATKSAKVLDAKKPTMVGIRHAKGGTATKVLRKNGNSKKTPETTKEKDNTSNSGILSDIVTTNKENRSEGSTYNAASSGIDSAPEGGVKRRGGLFLMKKTIKVIPRAQTVWRGDTTSNSISRIHKQLLPILQKQKSTDYSYYNNGNNDEEENKNSDDDDDDGEKNSHEEDNISKITKLMTTMTTTTTSNRGTKNNEELWNLMVVVLTVAGRGKQEAKAVLDLALKRLV